METTNKIQFIELLLILLKKWWLLLIFIFAGSCSAYLITSQFISPIYEAENVLYIGSENSLLESLNLSLSQLEVNNQLIQDYKQIALTRLIIDAVAENTYLTISDNQSDTNSTMTYQTFRNNTVITILDNSRLISIAFRDSDPQIAKQVSDELANQLMLSIPEIIGIDNIQIIDDALLPEDPISPKILYNLAIGGALGFIFAFFIIVYFSMQKNIIKNEDELSRLIGASVLGNIHNLSTNEKSLITQNTPTSLIAEDFNILKTNLKFKSNTHQVILFTSANKSEGKTTTISNLAISFAQDGKRVLLIDADLRRSQIQRLFMIEKNKAGLSNLLTENLEIESTLFAVSNFKKFDILTAGTQSVSPTELLNSELFAELISSLRTNYDIIFIDSPPILNLADANIVLNVADGVILVVANEETNTKAIKLAKKSVDKAGCELLGVVLTKVKSKNKRKVF